MYRTMRYTYKLTMADFECTFPNVDMVVEAVNDKTGVPIITKDMVYTLFTRPEKMNKRVFGDGKLMITRHKLPTKAEMALMQLAEIEDMTKSLGLIQHD